MNGSLVPVVALDAMATDVIVRTAVPDDLPQLQDIYRRASLSNAGDREILLRHPEHLIFSGSGVSAGRTQVAAVEGRLVGFESTVSAGVAQLELEDLFVDPDWQRCGVGRRLMSGLVRRAIADGMETLWVTGNPHASLFYLSVGFVEVGETNTELGVGFRLRLDLLP